MEEPRWELKKYEGKIITVIARYKRYDGIWNLFKPVEMEDGTIIDHMNIKYLKHYQELQRGKYYKITGKIVKYKSDKKNGGYDWGFKKYKVDIEPI